MGSRVKTPRAAIYNKRSVGSSDTSYSNGVYKFRGASVISSQMSVGYNNTPSSLSVTLVVDGRNGDLFLEPDIPSIQAFSYPLGGNGSVVFPESSVDLNPTDFDNTNVPFYFTGICTNWSAEERNVGGKTISVNLVDPREVLKGVQCLLSGFALSQNIGTGSETDPTPRYQLVDNVIDCFGYWAYGMESDKNEFGMQWSKIKESIEACGVTINEMDFEFYFTGDAFNIVPEWYRLNESIIDIVSLAQKVADDGGSDFVVIARKVSSRACVVEFRAIRRTNDNPLTQLEIHNFVNDRTNIVENFNLGKEYRNEPTSKIIIGGMKNSNYFAKPSEYKEAMHLSPAKKVTFSYRDIIGVQRSGVKYFYEGDNEGIGRFISKIQAEDTTATTSITTEEIEDYASFPEDITVRLFGGTHRKPTPSITSGGVTYNNEVHDVDSGAIFPYWGFAPGGETNANSAESSYPLIEPFLALDHLVVDRQANQYANLMTRIPLVKIEVAEYSVREVSHNDVFLDGDGDSDERPFARLQRNGLDIHYILGGANQTGYTRGLPLNTEVLRAALVGQELFQIVYSIHFPEIAKSMGFIGIDWKTLYANSGLFDFDARTLRIQNDFYNSLIDIDYLTNPSTGANPTKTSISSFMSGISTGQILKSFVTIIYEQVKQYAQTHMGRLFIVCLPKSTIMHRIWDDLTVPTRVEKPEIEYSISDRGYWEVVPTEFDGIQDTNDTITTDQERQIRRRFMAEDGRFYAMVAMDWKPEGNASFNSNGLNKAMFQDLPTSDFRPNKIADGNPEYVWIAASVSQFSRRPDLALLSLPNAVFFDPLDGLEHQVVGPSQDIVHESLATKGGLYSFFAKAVTTEPALRSMIQSSRLNYNIHYSDNVSFYEHANDVINIWVDQIYEILPPGQLLAFQTEPVMDLKGVLIPLVSNWVAYGPWYFTNEDAQGMVSVEVDESLVPWNFERPAEGEDWDENLNEAGLERLNRSLSVTDYIDSATITVAGFPEYGPASKLGFNSNLTTVSTEFGIGGVKTHYGLSTYSARPGTYRKSDYDNISQLLIDTRKAITDVQNINVLRTVNSYVEMAQGTNRFAVEGSRKKNA